MFMECLFIYISMTWNIHIRFSWLHAILIGNGSSKRVSSAGRLWRDDDGGLSRSGPVWIRKKSKHDFPLLSYANWVAGIWIWNWILSWVILIWENWGKDSFCWVEWLTLALNGAFKISYWGWIMHNYNLQQAVKSQPSVDRSSKVISFEWVTDCNPFHFYSSWIWIFCVTPSLRSQPSEIIKFSLIPENSPTLCRKSQNRN